jgi:tetratricopeptide (TPR) repeat protein
MNTDRIAQLHEQASERYLNGDYAGALQAWRDVLTMDPSNEQAMDGVRMASQFAEPQATSAATPADVERAVDDGLRVFDSLGASSPAPSTSDASATMMLNRDDVAAMIDRKPAAPAQTLVSEPKIATDLQRQNAGIDFGDLSDVPAIPLGSTDSQEMTEPEMDVEEEALQEPEEEAFGLEPMSPAAGAESSAAANELHRRVADLLAEANAKSAAGENDEALAILSRLSILDEENAEAAALREKLQSGGASSLDKVEQAIIEGVAALEADRLDDAERYFNSALELAPGHREAEHYLEKVAEKRSGSMIPGLDGGEDLLGSTDMLASPPTTAAEIPSGGVPLAAPGGDAPAKSKVGRPARSGAPDALDAPVLKPASHTKLPPMKWIVFGGLGAIALICGFIAVPQLMGGRAKSVPVPPPRPARTKPKSTPKIDASSPAGATMSPADRAKAIVSGLAHGQAQTQAGDFGGAVMSFNDVLRVDPANLEAKAGLNQAAAAYKAQKAEQDALESIRSAFKDGEYTSGLRLAYRLPPSISKAYTDTVKVIGWYNLGIVAMRAGDCREAVAHMNDALEIAPEDAESLQLKALAERYMGAPKDRQFLDQVESLPFRQLPAMTQVAAR